MKFYSAKGLTIKVMLGFLTVMSLAFLFGKIYPTFALVTVLLAYIIWAWADTYYTVTGNEVLYRSALVRGAICIASITEIQKNTNLSSGIRPALSAEGVVVKYNRWDEIFFSPEDVDGFIAEVIKSNPAIKQVEN